MGMKEGVYLIWQRFLGVLHIQNWCRVENSDIRSNKMHSKQMNGV